MHEQIGAGREDERVENVGDHEDGIQHDGQAEENGFVDLEDLRGKGNAADFAEGGFA